MPRRFISLAVLMAASVLISGCSSSKMQNMLNDGASNYGDGKTEENYHFKDSGILLDELIDKYSGSYYQPTGTPMTDDEYDNAKKAHGSSPSTPDPSAPSSENDTGNSSDNSEIPEVSNMTELLRVFHNAYDNTSEYVEFTAVDGFTFDMSDGLQTVYTTLQREDPIDVSGVASWTTWNRGNEYYISIYYSFDIDELKQIKAATTQLVEEAVQKITPDGLSEYEIVCAVNDYLCDTVYYPESEPYEPVTHTAYGALKNGVAVCEGYACAAKLILNGCGVECDIQVGECLDGGGHGWNLVKVDGMWYQLDVTWNDQSNERSDYLLVTDEYMKQSRTWKESDYPVSSKVPYSA